MQEPRVTKELAAEHGLTPTEYNSVQRILGREPTFTELGIFSVMWSEHCSYKSSRVHLSKFPTSGPRVLQGPGENAGIVDVGDSLAVAFKMESHNHPSFIEPYQGAATGVGGILRDVFTMGARPIACLDALWFGEESDPRTPYLTSGVVKGIGDYGNCFGVPTVGGSTTFSAAYNQNILVNAMAVGLVRNDRIFRAAAGGVGNPVMYVGAKTGRDGIHGATMASEQFDTESESKRPTVQVGDPFTEKLLLEALMELFETDHVVGIQDMGAAGLTSSSVEMAGRAGTGIDLDLDKVPTREVGMSAYELMLSESQERMLIVAHRGREEAVQEIFAKWDLECVVVGEVTDTGRLVVRKDGAVRADIPVGPIADEAPKYRRESRAPEEAPVVQGDDVPEPTDLGATLTDLLGSPNIRSSAWVWHQYDHTVQTNTVIGPGGDAAVVRIPGTKRGVAVTTDCNSRYCFVDPRAGAEGAVAEAARNIAAVGGEPLAITDCLNFGSPEVPEVMWQFEQAIEGLSEGCRRLEIAVVSGNVSFYNETEGAPIWPTPSVGMVGLLEDVSRHARIGFVNEDDEIWLVGDAAPQLGASEYLEHVHGKVLGPAPVVSWESELAAQSFVRDGVRAGWIESAHDVSVGGLAVALAECVLAGPAGAGARVEIPNDGRADVAWFGESHGRFVISASPDAARTLEEHAGTCGVPVTRLGIVGGGALTVGSVSVALDALETAHTGRA